MSFGVAIATWPTGSSIEQPITLAAVVLVFRFIHNLYGRQYDCVFGTNDVIFVVVVSIDRRPETRFNANTNVECMGISILKIRHIFILEYDTPSVCLEACAFKPGSNDLGCIFEHILERTVSHEGTHYNQSDHKDGLSIARNSGGY